MEFRGPILCATDLSDTADAALRQGYAIGAQIGAPVSVCHVLPEAFNVRVLFPQQAGIDTPFQEELIDKATSAVRTQLETAIGAASTSVPIEIETGTAHAGILRVAERLGAGLVVVGHGGTAVRVARSASVPVLIARPSPAGASVLGATDFSDPSLPAVHMAAGEARRRGARLRVVNCLDIDLAAYAGGAGLRGLTTPWPWPQELTDRLEAAARERLTAAVGKMNVAAEVLVLRSSPASGILDAAQSVPTALIVVGTRGRTGLARLALGSVAETVINRAPCSVLVVPLYPASS